MITIKKLLRDNSEVSFYEKRALLGKLTGFTNTKLLINDEYVLSTAVCDKYHALLLRLKKGEPLAYILGFKEFYSRNFIVGPATLIPRPETELLVEKALKIAPKYARILDLGTGSGCIAITLKLERKDLTVVAVDNCPDALAIAQKNAIALGIGSSEVQFYQSDWFNKVKGKYNLIISNPPYISYGDPHLVDLTYEPQHALTDFNDGLECIREIALKAYNFIMPKGYLLLEHGYNQQEKIERILGLNGFINISKFKDYASLDRIIVAQVN